MTQFALEPDGSVSRIRRVPISLGPPSARDVQKEAAASVRAAGRRLARAHRDALAWRALTEKRLEKREAERADAQAYLSRATAAVNRARSERDRARAALKDLGLGGSL